MKKDTVTIEEQRIIDISFAMAEGGRRIMIHTILETSGEELENIDDWVEVAKETDVQLRFRLHNILQYYLKELKNRD